MTRTKTSRLTEIYRQSILRPPYTTWSFARRFWIYQNERFPLIAFIIICSGTVMAISHVVDHFDWPRIAIAASMAVAYFLQIRLADEPKDYEHDNKYHPTRPVQRGVVTLTELNRIKNACIILFFALALLTGSWVVILLACLQQGYSFLTRKEFFLRDWLRQHFFLYQFSHYMQLLILAWLLLMAANITSTGHDLFIYFGYIIAMIAPIEASRTIGGSDEAGAKDRYSHLLGVPIALGSYLLLTAAATAYTVWLIYMGMLVLNPIPITIGLIAVTVASLRYYHAPIAKNAFLLNIMSLVMYTCCVVTILIG